MEVLKNCPACNSGNHHDYLNCKDHFLSGETFTIQECKDCGLLFTNPRPEADKLGSYYQSTEYISHSNSRKGLFNGIYQLVRKYTLSKKYSMIRELTQGRSIMDIGCATGEFLAMMKKNGWEVLGIEPDEKTRKQAEKLHSLPVFPEAHLNSLKDSSFDVISMWHVLEHVSDLRARMNDVQRLLKPGGILIIAVPNPESWDAHYYKTYWAAYDVPRHLYHFTKKSMDNLLSHFSFSVKKIVPMKFDSYYVSLLSEKYKGQKMKWISGLWNGYWSNCKARGKNNHSSLIFVVEKGRLN